MNKLNNKQIQFCHEYLKDFNATKAALRSGYSERSAGSIGAENLKKPEIRDEISRLSASIFNNHGLTLNRILNEVMSIAFSFEVSNFEKLKALEILLKHKLSEPQSKDRKDLKQSTKVLLATMRRLKLDQPREKKDVQG